MATHGNTATPNDNYITLTVKKPIRANLERITMILSLILTAYFILIISQQSTSIHRMQRIYRQACIRNRMLSPRDLVKISERYHNSRQYYGYVGARNSFVSGRLSLSSNGRLYRHIFTNGRKSVRFYSYGMALDEVISLVDFTPEYINTHFTYNISVSSSTMFAISAPSMA